MVLACLPSARQLSSHSVVSAAMVTPLSSWLRLDCRPFPICVDRPKAILFLPIGLAASDIPIRIHANCRTVLDVAVGHSHRHRQESAVALDAKFRKAQPRKSLYTSDE